MTTVELSFDGKFFVDDSIKLHGTNRNLLWQKERMLNLGIQELLDQYEYIAWIDCDVLFGNRYWFDDAVDVLQKYPVAQLYDYAYWLDADGRVVTSWPSLAGKIANKEQSNRFGHTGFAWAARSDVLTDGLLDLDITGNGDFVMAQSWLGQWSLKYFDSFNPVLRALCLQWGSSQYLNTRGEIGVVPGRISHLFHGSLKNRSYQERVDQLMDLGFDPTSHLIKDNNGLWAWSDSTPVELKEYVRSYFHARKEDERD